MPDKDFLIERNILKIGNTLLNKRSDDLKEFDITSNQSETLLFFDKNEGAPISNLKEHLKISHQAARNIIERMKEKDLLYVTVSDSDARVRKVYLTENGKKICEELKLKGSNVGGNILRYLNNDEKQELLVLLEKILKSI